MARVFPEVSELVREEVGGGESLCASPSPSPLVGCYLGDWSFGEEAWELGEAASKCSVQ